ncbi:MAG: LLM class flavin-dependent oxidoreductase [Kutzneria sp.]|nr:LLM class flavin-dependent oxidoreductase [Kutzneria sp.]
MIFGVNFFPVVDPAVKNAPSYFDDCLQLTRLAENLEFEHIQAVEHYFTPYGGYFPDPVTFLAAAAAQTERIRLTTGAVIPAFTHPVKLAGKLAMLDNLSHGRLDVGIGRGFLPDEFAAFGVPMDESRDRFIEGIEACRRLWSEQDVVYHGRFHRFGPVTLLPRPIQRPHPPIFVASATSPESCGWAGRGGYHLQVVPSVTSREKLAEMLAAYRREWAAGGGAPDGGRIQIKYTCYLAKDRTRALRHARTMEHNYVDKMAGAVASWASTRSDCYQGYEQFVDKIRAYDFDIALRNNKVLAGTPAAVADQLATIRDWYGDDLTISLQFNPGFTSLTEACQAMELFGTEVAPLFAPASATVS